MPGLLAPKIHLQHSDVAYMADTLYSFLGMILPVTGGIVENKDSPTRKQGIIIVKFPYETPPEKVAGAMLELISKTLDVIEDKYKVGSPEAI